MATATRTRKTNSPAKAKAAAEARTKELAELKALFDEKVLTLTSSDQWMNMLKAMSYFHRYSFQNMLLIWAQNPDATYCTGYQNWKKMGYQVRKGEKGLRIYAPVAYIRKDEDGQPLKDDEGNEIKGLTFRPVSTFDRSQVEPTDKALPMPEKMTTTLEGADELGVAAPLREALTGQGWKVRYEPIAGTSHGYTRPTEKLIVIDSKNPEAQQARTLIHEAAHALLHTELEAGEYVQHRGLYETEAESVAYVVASALGWDTANYSVGYVAGWSEGQTETLAKSGENVLKASRTILDWIAPEAA